MDHRKILCDLIQYNQQYRSDGCRKIMNVSFLLCIHVSSNLRFLYDDIYIYFLIDIIKRLFFVSDRIPL